MKVLKRGLFLVSIFLSVSLASAATAAPGGLNSAALGPDGLTVVMTSIQKVLKSGSTQVSISYTLKNNTPDKKIDEGAFKLFYSDGSSDPQYGFFGTLFPGDTVSRSYTWEFLNAQHGAIIEYGSGFFGSYPDSSNPEWAISQDPSDIAAFNALSSSTSASSANSSSSPSAPKTEAQYQVCIEGNKILSAGSNPGKLPDCGPDPATQSNSNSLQVNSSNDDANVNAASDAANASADSATSDASDALAAINSLATTVASNIAIIKSQVSILLGLMSQLKLKS